MTFKEALSVFILDQFEEKERSPLRKVVGVLLLIALAFTLGLLLFQNSGSGSYTTYVPLKIADQEYYLEYAPEGWPQIQGLGFRAPLANSGGIFFDSGKHDYASGANFPLTILALSERLQVLEVVHLQQDERHKFDRSYPHLIKIPIREDIEPGEFLEHFVPDPSWRLFLKTFETLNNKTFLNGGPPK